MIRALLAIDPGSKRTGLAVLGYVGATREPLLPWVGHHDPKSHAEEPFTAIVRRVIDAVALDGYEVSSAVIEDQYVKENKKSSLTLAHTAGRWVEACVACGLAWEFVPASTWQAASLRRLVPTTNGRAGRDDLKAAAVRHAARLWGVHLGQDEADAALLGRFAALRDAHTAMVRGARRR